MFAILRRVYCMYTMNNPGRGSKRSCHATGSPYRGYATTTYPASKSTINIIRGLAGVSLNALRRFFSSSEYDVNKMRRTKDANFGLPGVWAKGILSWKGF